ncbi:MAG: ammonium transporter [Nitrososphaerota archaeon]
MPIDTGDTTWMLISTGLVMMMTPALGFFEAGLIRSKNSISVLMQTFSGLGILSILWVVIGFTLSFGPSSGGIIGNLDYVALNNVPIDSPIHYAQSIPGIGFVAFNMMVAVITPLLITGAFAEKMKWTSFCIFIIAWSIFIYCPLAHWVWGGGWLSHIGFYDFGGGIVVHVSAGMGSLAAALIMGRRKYFGPDITLPHNVPLAVIGASLLWFGWYGFNAGGAYAAGGLTFNILLVTHMASASSSITWIVLSWKTAGKPSVISGINGAIAGLAGVTAASGFITIQSAMVLGIVIGVASFLAIRLIKEHLKIDDVLDVSSVHGISAIVGTLAVGILASQAINANGPNGLLYGNLNQIGIQALGVGIAIAFSFVGTFIILKIVDKTIGLRVKEIEEDVGLDISEHAERAYSR